jgi:hypothetical protein
MEELEIIVCDLEKIIWILEDRLRRIEDEKNYTDGDLEAEIKELMQILRREDLEEMKEIRESYSDILTTRRPD